MKDVMKFGYWPIASRAANNNGSAGSGVGPQGPKAKRILRGSTEVIIKGFSIRLLQHRFDQRPLGYECDHQQNLKTLRGAKSNALFLAGIK